MRTNLHAVVILAALFILPGCSGNYYKTTTLTRKAKYARAIEKAKEDKQYFILYSGINIYSVTSVDVDKPKQQFTVQLDKVDSMNMANLGDSGTKRPRPKTGEGSSLSKILVYMSDSTSYTLDEPHTLPIDKVAKIELVH